MFKKIKDFCVTSYAENPMVFFVEMTSVILAIIGNILLSYYSNSPPMFWILLIYGISSTLMGYVMYKRKSALFVLLMIFYTINSAVGIYFLKE